jgi:hypothetical protein
MIHNGTREGAYTQVEEKLFSTSEPDDFSRAEVPFSFPHLVL